MPMSEAKPLHDAGIPTMFLVWSYPQGSHRSQFFANTLGMRLQYVYFTRRRGALAAALKYPVQALQTLWVLLRHRPRLVFVQDPPTLAAFVVWFCGLFLRCKFIIDTHTQRHLLVDYQFLMGMRHFVAHRALTNIVTNDYLVTLLNDWNAPAIVMEDPPLPFAKDIQAEGLAGDFNLVWVNVGAVDEPRDVFFEAARQLPHITFYVTSDYGRNQELRQCQATAPDNVIFTGHLPDTAYYQLLKSADAVLTLTTRNHALQQGACEAMWLGRPVITSDWPMLRRYFSKGAIFVDNSVESLVGSITQMQTEYDRYSAEILEIDALRRADWNQQVDALMQIINEAFAN